MNPYAIIGALLLAFGLAGGGYWQGWEKRGDHEATIALAVERKAAKALKDETERADRLAGELTTEKLNIKTVTIEKIKEVPTVTTVYKETPNAPAQAIPDAVYTAGFVRVWNGAYGTMLMPAGSGKFAGPAGETDLVRAKIGSADILSNHVENAGKHAECYAQLNRLIDFELGRPQ